MKKTDYQMLLSGICMVLGGVLCLIGLLYDIMMVTSGVFSYSSPFVLAGIILFVIGFVLFRRVRQEK